ncbi:MAG TPA: AraC family transcriptional regulator [Puia sp.]|jgi:AraC-like DNA-binding protein|nr:AraC family transcriptional regulator [Puia sp.]
MDSIDRPAAIEEQIGNMLYSCIQERRRANEQYTPEHSIGYIIAGSVQFFTAAGVSTHEAGSMGFVKGNFLVKTTKIPPPGGQFLSISLHFSSEALQRYATDHRIRVTRPYEGIGMHSLDGNPFLRGFFDSLLPYFHNRQPLSDALLAIKTNEAIELLLQHDPDLRNLLFDFNEPHKIDLLDYMDRHFMFNVPLDRFARLTGRSLAGFKRDFEKTYRMSPGKWLQQRRLTEAHRLISMEGRKPSDVYLDVGFENLSHFSFCFKKAYGQSPSALAK